MRQNIFRHNKKGVVLLTVICVMVILIITVTATLAVVASAQKKSITNYQDSQSYITAKSIVDSYCENLKKTSSPLQNGFETASTSSSTIPVLMPTGVTGMGKAGDIKIEHITPDKVIQAETKVSASGVNPEQYVTKVEETYKISETVTDNVSTSTVSRIIKIVNTKTRYKTHTTSGATPSDWDSAAKALESLGIATSTNLFGGSSSNDSTQALAGLGGSTNSWFYNGDVNLKDSGNPIIGNLGGAANLAAGKSIVAMGDFKLSNDVDIRSISDGSGKTPFIYAGKKFIDSGSNKPIGADGKPINIICHGGEVDTSTTINGNVYSGGNFSLTNEHAKINGSMYVNGNVSINTSCIQNAATAADIKAQFSGTVHYSGSATEIDTKIADMIKNGNQDGANALKSIFVKDADLTKMNLDGTKSTEADDPNDPADDKSTADDNRTLINLPTSSVSETITLPTAQDTFGSCLDKTGNPLTADKKLGDDYNNFTGTSATTLAGADYGTKEITTKPGETTYINLTGGNYSGDIIVTGGGKVEILSTGDCNLQNFRLITDTTKDMIDKSKTFMIGNNDPTTLTAASNIYWYVKDGTKLNLDSIGSGNNLVNAYIYAIGKNTEVNINSKGIKLNINDSGALAKDIRTSILGSVIGQNIKIGDGTALAYIDPNAGQSTSNGGGTPDIWTSPTNAYDWATPTFTIYNN